MPQIFHPSMNTISRVTIFGFVFLIAALIGIGYGWVRSPYFTEEGVVRVQPVPFSHQHHVGDVGIDCRYCHRTVETEAFAGVPSTEVCMDCHSYLWDESPILAPVRESFATGEPLFWSRVHDLGDFAYFHHGIHIQKGIACDVCHGPVGKMPLMYREESLHMEWCLDCHRNPEKYQSDPKTLFARQVSPNLRGPQTHDIPAGQESRRIPGLLDEASEALPVVESKTDCSICHR